MVERKLFKTKLCVLYQRGHCSRQSCSFAHGDAELRRFSGSYGGRRDYRDSDLRDKLDRRPSPERRYSPGRDARGRNAFQGYSPMRSIDKKSDRSHKKKEYLDGQSDFSENFKIANEMDGRFKERRNIHDQLKEVQRDIDRLDRQKIQLGIVMEEKVQEADTLTSQIQELESQLEKEKQECKKISLKIKKFVKAHNRCSHIQDELKRAQVRLEKSGEQLHSTTRTSDNEQDSNINIVSDGETDGYHILSKQKEIRQTSSLNKKRLRENQDIAYEPMSNGGGHQPEVGRLRKQSRWNTLPTGSKIEKEVESLNNEKRDHKPLTNDEKLIKGKQVYNQIPAADKLKGTSYGPVLPSTSMAAHAVDETVEIEEENVEVLDTTAAGNEIQDINGVSDLPFLLPPPPPVPRNTYLQYQGEDQNVDIGGLEEMADVDIV